MHPENVKTSTSNVTQNFKDEYEDGEFMPLHRYAASVDLAGKFANDSELISYSAFSLTILISAFFICRHSFTIWQRYPQLDFRAFWLCV